MVYLILLGILTFIIGFTVGYLYVINITQKRIFGTIKWNWDDGEPYFFLDMDRRPEEMIGYKYVVFKTELKSPPQK